MDYHALSRRELQALCKQHKIPANKTNIFMADALSALLNGAGVDDNPNTDAFSTVAPAAPADEPNPETIFHDPTPGDVRISSDTSNTAKKTRGRPARRGAVSDAVPLALDDCATAKVGSSRTIGRGKVLPESSLTSSELCDVAESSTYLTDQAPKVNSTGEIGHGGTAPEHSTDVSAAITPILNEESTDASTSKQEVPAEEALAILCGNSQTVNDIKEATEGDVGVQGCPLDTPMCVEGDSINALSVAGHEEVSIRKVVPDAQPQEDLIHHIQKLTLEDDAPADGDILELKSRKRTGRRTGRAKKATSTESVVVALGMSGTTEVVDDEAPADVLPAPSVADANGAYRVGSKRVGRSNKVTTVVMLKPESETAAAALEQTEPGDCENLTNGIHATNESLPEVEVQKLPAKRIQKVKKGARAADNEVDLKVPGAAAAVADGQADVSQAGDIDGHCEQDPVDMVEADVLPPKVVTKKVKGSRKKVGKSKGGIAKAIAHDLEVYVDASFVTTPETVETDDTESEFVAAAPKCHNGVYSPVEVLPSLLLGGVAPSKSPSLAHMSSPPSSPSLAYMGNESDCDMDGDIPIPNAKQVNYQSSASFSSMNADEEADKENSGRKHNVTDIPKSLRKLRKQLKEAIIKKNVTPVSSPLKDMSLNVPSPLPALSPSFSFRF